MTRYYYKFQDQSGVTLAELLIVIVIIGIVSSIAMMRLRTPKDQFSRQNVSRELKVAFERARFDSVKRRADVVTIGGNTVDKRAKVIIDINTYTLVTDLNGNGLTTDAEDSVVSDFAAQNVSISSGLTLPVTVYFNQRGEVTDVNGVTMTPVFYVCNGTCNSNNATSSNANIVLVTPTGTVNLLPGNGAVPTFATPNVTTVPGNTNISNLAVVN